MIKVGVRVALVLPLLLAGCSQSAGSPSAPVGSAQSSQPPGTAAASSAAGSNGTPDAIRVSVGLAEIRGHHAVSLILLDSGDQQGALAHAGHPIAEILPGIKGELDAHGVKSADIDAALRTAADAVDDRAPKETVRDLYAKVATLTDGAERAVAGAAADSTTYRGSVIASLLSTAAGEYEEAIKDGKVAELIEYQDAYGFVKEAHRLYAIIEAEVRARAPHEADEAADGFKTLDAALVAPQPPTTPATVQAFQDAAAKVGNELAEAIGSTAVAAADPGAIVEEIGERLDEMLAAYRAGNVDSAMDMAAEAYLDGYEKIEGDVIGNAKAINDELEPLLASQLRARMKDGAPVTEIETMVTRAKKLLADALVAIHAAAH